MINSFLTIINLCVMGIVIGMGFYYANQENWTKDGGFLPYGFSGVIAGNMSVTQTSFTYICRILKE